MKRFGIVIIFCLLGFVAKGRQPDPILTIGGESFELGEFWHVYNKNKHLSGFSESPEVFAERFINYKLKVVEARQRGLDTLSTFKQEFERYVSDLSHGFLVDSSALEGVVEKAYANMQELVEASHILVVLAEDAAPEDTVLAWRRISDWRRQILSGSDFNALAARHSEDPSARQNSGHLGFFSAFRMIYPFEEAAFSTPVDSVSPVFRTRFGYHILKVHDRRPNPGRIRVAHLMKMFEEPGSSVEDPQLEKEIGDLYRRIQEGASFEDLVRENSDDRNSARQGGEMPAFGWGEMIPEFAMAAFALQEDGAVSAPVRTDYGWHLIKRLELDPVGSLDEEAPYIMSMLARDGRNNAGRHAFVAQRMGSAEMGHEDRVLEEIYTALENSADKSSFLSALGDLDRGLLYYKDRTLSVGDFVERVRSNERFSLHSGRVAVDQVLDAMSRQLVLETEKELLALNNPAYRYLVNEYFDGLLIYEISSQEIWNEGASDSLALRTYYNKHLSDFTPVPQLTGTVCGVESRSLMRRLQKKRAKSGDTVNVVQILKESARNKSDYRCESGSFAFVGEASDPLDADLLPDDSSLRELGSVLYWSGQVELFEPHPYEEVTGEVMSAYQQQLEADWIRDMRQRYKPQFNYRLLKKAEADR